jgi:hypothetical protein
MIKAYLGIDPGLSNIGLTLRLAGSSTFASEFIPINVPLPIKRGFANNQEAVNWKLRQVFFRVRQAVKDLLAGQNLLPSEVFGAVEAFLYRPSSSGKSFNNSSYDTVAAVAVIKAVLFESEIEFVEIISTQMRRILTWHANGVPDDNLDKTAVEGVVKNILGDVPVSNLLKIYAKGHHEHIVDSMAFSIVVEHRKAYQEYMKIPLKKRKKMLGSNSADNQS